MNSINNKTSTIKKIWIIPLLWLIILGGIIGMREHQSSVGTTIYLDIIPIDPLDIFRGEYVHLEYKMSVLNPQEKQIDKKYNKKDLKKGADIYTKIDTTSGEILEAFTSYPTEKLKKDEIIIKGQIKRINNSQIIISYKNIERFYLPQGKGKEVENNINNYQAKIIVNKKGLPMIKSLIEKE